MSASTAPLSAALDLLCQKLLEDEPTLGTRFPYVTHPDGSWDLMPVGNSAGYREGKNWDHGNWFCGFWVGLLAAAKLHSGRDEFLDLAQDRMVLVAERSDDPNTHDIGFIFISSALPLYHITGDKRWRDMAIQAANRLRARLVVTAKGAYISSWGPMTDERGRSSSAIDTMANIPLLYWASRETGDASYAHAAKAHALHSLGAFVRDDLTMYHAVEYDTVTGERVRGYTFQGLADDSSWSRGTGWAVYGLAASAEATGEAFFIGEAEKLAEKWLSQLGDKVVPPWDFDDKSDGPEDSSASAIMAAAMLDLASLQSDPARAQYWRDHAMRLLTGMCESYLATESSHRGLLKHSCYSKPHNVGVDSAVMFGDYFFVEALMRVCHEGALLPAKTILGTGNAR